MEIRRAPWKLDDGRMIHLIEEKEFNTLPDGEVLTSIKGEQLTKGVDYCDLDTRGGFLAFGLLADHDRCQASYTTVLRDEFIGLGT